MFLDETVQQVISDTREQYPWHFEHSFHLNNLAHRVVASVNIKSGNVQQMLLAALEHKALTSFQGVLILIERGLDTEAKCILRTLLEVTFRTVAIAKEPANGLAYIQQDELKRRKFINKYSNISTEARNEDNLKDLEALRPEVARKILEQGIKEIKTQDYARLADLLDFYNSAYAVLSESVHVNVGELESSFVKGSSGELKALYYGPRNYELPAIVETACEACYLTLCAVHSVIETPHAKEIEASHKILREFVKKIHA
jgi:hypothetical protein